jgi:acyl carrier protein
MDDASAIEQVIIGYIGATMNGDAPVEPDENLFTSGYVDSVGIVRLIAHLESTYGVRIPPTDLVPQNFRTVRTMTAYLLRIRSQV